MQKYTSRDTSINKNKLPAIFNKINWEILVKACENRAPRVLDIGAGKFTCHIKNFLLNKGIIYYLYDPYNLTLKNNIRSLNCKPDFIVCSNVFNVIDDAEEIQRLHNLIISFKKPYGISIYEGNKSGKGGITKHDCYQRNQKTSSYLFETEIIRRSIITASQYKNFIY